MITRAYSPDMNEYNRDKCKYLLGLYQGVVVSNDDPLEIGRVKVLIPGINDDVEPYWAMPNFPSASGDSGTFIVPEEKANVWIMFLNGDELSPVWIGTFYSNETTKAATIGNTYGKKRSRIVGSNETPPEARGLDKKMIYKSEDNDQIYVDTSDNKDRIVIKDKNKHEIVLGDEEVRIKIKDRIIKIEKDKDVVIQNSEDQKIVVDDDGVHIKTNESEVNLDKASVEIKQNESTMRVTENLLSAEVGDSQFHIGSTYYKVSNGITSINGTSTSLSMASGPAYIIMRGGDVTISASNINLNGHVNMPD